MMIDRILVLVLVGAWFYGLHWCFKLHYFFGMIYLGVSAFLAWPVKAMLFHESFDNKEWVQVFTMPAIIIGLALLFAYIAKKATRDEDPNG